MITVAGKQAVRARIVVPAVGPWYADVELAGDDVVAGGAEIAINGKVFFGTVDATASGAYGNVRTLRIVGGAGGWARVLPPRHYHSDARLRGRTIADQAAQECGETIVEYAPQSDTLGIDYVRQLGAASRALEHVIGTAAWWVGYDGDTRVGSRMGPAAKPGSIDVLSYDPATRTAEIGVTDPHVVQVGSPLDVAGGALVTDLEIVVSDGMTIIARCADPSSTTRDLAASVRAIVARAGQKDSKVFGKYRYRVVRHVVDRVECQVVNSGNGLPDLMAISMVPGVAGAHAELTPGSEVLVEFIEGDRQYPIITHFAGKDGVGHVPVSLALCGGTQAVARQGDVVRVGGPGTTVVFAGAGPTMAPGVPYTVTFASIPAVPGQEAPLYGAIISGSPKVRA